MPSLVQNRFIALVLLLIATALPCHAQRHHGGQGDDRVSFGHDITIHEGESVADIACAFCTVHLHGDVRGDVAILFGRVEVSPGQTIAGDVALLGGNVDLADGASINGDAAVFGGDIREANGASVHGDRVVVPGLFWIVMLPLAPLLILAGFIWLIVWLVRRARYGAPLVRRY